MQWFCSSQLLLINFMLRINNLILLKESCLTPNNNLWVLEDKIYKNKYCALPTNSCCLITDIYNAKDNFKNNLINNTLFKFKSNKIIEFLFENQLYYYFDLRDYNDEPLWCKVIS